jgi:hypothetical protein
MDSYNDITMIGYVRSQTRERYLTESHPLECLPEVQVADTEVVNNIHPEGAIIEGLRGAVRRAVEPLLSCPVVCPISASSLV